MACHILLEDRTGYGHAEYSTNGNVLLNRLLGAEISHHPAGTDMDAAMEAVAQESVRHGRRPYIIPGGGSNPTGAVGYVSCALEMIAQANDMALPVTWVVHGTGSAGTQAGLVTGVEACRSVIKVMGISVRAAKGQQAEKVLGLASATAAKLQLQGLTLDKSVLVDDRFVGPGYGQPTDAMVDAVRIAARHEGLLLDPVYTGKAMAGLIALVREGYFRRDDVVVFLHTGGAQALAGYAWAFSEER
jgi:L-cysteate sulfo-lyase